MAHSVPKDEVNKHATRTIILGLPVKHFRFAFHGKENEVDKQATRRIVLELPAEHFRFAFHGKENEIDKHAVRRIVLELPAKHFLINISQQQTAGREAHGHPTSAQVAGKP